MVNLNYCNRNVNGILLIDKPKGLSSNGVLHQVKQLFRVNKIGHTGSLDPLATGMLPMCLGEATKFAQYLLDSDKLYRVIARLGERTNTSDSEGQVVSVRPVKLNEIQLNRVLECFKGKIYQVPSMFSALKYQGCPLYKYARKGMKVARSARLINIYNFDLISWDIKTIELEVYCSKGTYIRTLIDDIGEYIGCGAHVTALRRLRVGQYHQSLMVDLDFLRSIANNSLCNFQKLEQLDSLLFPMDSGMIDIPSINLSKSFVTIVRFGRKIKINTSLQDGLVRMTEGKKKIFFGIGEIINSQWLLPRRLVTNTVLSK